MCVALTCRRGVSVQGEGGVGAHMRWTAGGGAGWLPPDGRCALQWHGRTCVSVVVARGTGPNARGPQHNSTDDSRRQIGVFSSLLLSRPAALRFKHTALITMLAAMLRRAQRPPLRATARWLATDPPPPPATSPLADAELLGVHAGATVDAYDGDGFDLTGGLRVEGGVLLAAPGGVAVRWRGVDAPADVTRASLALARLVSPPPDIVIIGTGAVLRQLPAVTAEAVGGAACEFAPTARAAALFNVLAREGRSVVAALLPAGV